jgi:hypothetical protein
MPDVSTFMARRVQLGGLRSGMRALAGPGSALIGGGTAAAIDPSILAVVVATLGVRSLAKAIANPSRLKMATLALKKMKQDKHTSLHSAGMMFMALEGGLNDGSE